MRAAFDFETWEWTNPLCVGFAWGPPGEREYHYIHDKSGKHPDKVEQAALIYMASRQDVKTWWAHNGGRFDSQFLLRAAVTMGWTVDAHVSGTRAVKMSFRPPGVKKAMHVHDSLAMMASSRSLKTCATDFQLASRKLFHEGDYSVDVRKWDKDRLREGCLRDCDLVLELLERLETLVADWGGEIRSTFSGTALTMVRAALDEQGLEFPTHGADLAAENGWCRQGYYGGRVEVIHHKPKGRLIEHDVCSSYPWSMTQPLPWEYLGHTTSKRGLERMLEGERAGVIEAEVEVPPKLCKGIPPLPFRPKGGGIYFPVGKWRGHWASVELAYARRLGVKVRPLEGYAYTVERPFNEFVKRVYRVKQTAPKGALRCFAKDTLNGCYGKFGQSPDREVLMLVGSEEEADALLSVSRPGTIGQLGDDPRFLMRKAVLWAWHTHYALAATITAHSRIKLHRAMVTAKGLAYVDTDATHARSNSVRVSSELGAWKVEEEGYFATFWAPKIYELHRGGKHTYAAKGFTLASSKAFRTLVRCESLTIGDRNMLLKSQFRSGGKLARVPQVKRWGGRSRKRCPLPDGSTRPWSVEELAREEHERALSPNLQGRDP